MGAIGAVGHMVPIGDMGVHRLQGVGGDIRGL